ncbi:peptide chain release factor N(5)-glutamine methyltransferase [Acidithiobacillus sp.]|uniref:peptide chain release factor N(5)-glutamine methyltransferase n=1 Tax=Acidithiobacillus sp. TaxID=1872118 RepID=UPI0025C0AC7E|nr:peptide chain release factor N(5)-glutamine methyltransferase [Acidithiobacillus sp.]
MAVPADPVPIVEVQRRLARALAEVSDQPQAEARWLLEASLAWDAATLLRRADESLPTQLQTRLQTLLARRLAGEPLAYCLGRAPFLDFELEVSPAVLIPRADTEVLVEAALERMPVDAATQVLDLGTGSGAVALAIARSRPRARVTAVDKSAAALTVAERNGRALGVEVQWQLGHWCRDLPPGQRFDLVLSNPPYLAADDRHLADLSHEPTLALVAGPTGYEAFTEILRQIGGRLRGGAWLLFEHGWEQGPGVRERLRAAGFTAVFAQYDQAGRERVSGGRWTGIHA